jgi:hypothetical protein
MNKLFWLKNKAKRIIDKYKEDVFQLLETHDTKLDRFLASKRYKESKYTLQRINGRYALKGSYGTYVDFCNPAHRWTKHNSPFKDCLGSLNKAIRAFNYVEPVIKEFKIETL